MNTLENFYSQIKFDMTTDEIKDLMKNLWNQAIEEAAKEAWHYAANVGNHGDANYVADGVRELKEK